ncbi:MAG TPA: hypothetical protein VF016_11000 [Nitrososphaera sp.]
MFDSSIDAFFYAIRKSGSAMDVQTSIGYMNNGIKRCSVQVSCDGDGGSSSSGGACYSIVAYGQEADALYQEAIKYSKKERRVIIV